MAGPYDGVHAAWRHPLHDQPQFLGPAQVVGQLGVGPAQFRLAAQLKTYPAQVGAVAQMGGGGLERDREAEPLGGPYRGVGVGRGESGQHADAVAGQEALGVGGGQLDAEARVVAGPAARTVGLTVARPASCGFALTVAGLAARAVARGAVARGEQHLNVGGSTCLVDVVVPGDPPGLGGLLPPARVPHGLGERAHGPLGGGVGGDPAGARGGLATGAGQGLREFLDLQVDHGHRLGRTGPGSVGRLPYGRGECLRAAVAVPGAGISVADRGNGGDHDGVAGVVGKGLGQGAPEIVRGGGRGQVAGRQRAEPLGEAGVVGDQAERLGVAEDGDARTGGQRLGGEQYPGVGEFGDGVDPDDARLPQQIGDGGVRDLGGGHGMAGGGAAGVAGALDDDHRFDGGGAPGQPGELAGVADRLQVHQDDIGVRIVVPVLEEVVARDIGTVTRGDEGRYSRDPGQARQPGAAPVQPGQQCDANRPGLGEQAQPPGVGQPRGQGGIQPDSLGGVADAEGVGADDAHAVRPGLADEVALPVAALAPALGVSGGEHDEALDAVLAAFGHDSGHPVGGDGHDGEVHGLLYGAQRAVGRDTLGREVRHVVGEGVVDGVDAPREAAVQEVAQHGAADAAGRAAGADDGDGAGREQPLDGAGLGPLLAGAHDGQGAVGGFEIEFEADDPVLEAALLGVARVREHLDHLGVGGQHLGGEPADVALACDGGDVFEERGGHPTTLVGVLDEEGDLGLVGGGRGRNPPSVDAVVAHRGDELIPHDGRQAHPVDVVVVGEAVDIAVGQAGIGREEAVVLRLVRHPFVEAHQPLGVIRGDGTDLCRAAVSQHHIGFPVGRVGVMVRRAPHGAQGTGPPGPDGGHPCVGAECRGRSVSGQSGHARAHSDIDRVNPDTV
ncbi:hypothetical protein SANTM175S_06739 [Streptomyces antimycoticus]